MVLNPINMSSNKKRYIFLSYDLLEITEECISVDRSNIFPHEESILIIREISFKFC